MGVPPHWMIYIAVDNVDTAVAKAEQSGGKILAPAFDVMDAGRMAVVQDPTGAGFCLWKAQKNTGIGIAQVAGTLCWADLSTPDVKRASDFYSGLFRWQIITDPKDPSGYLPIKNAEHFIGGIPPQPIASPACRRTGWPTSRLMTWMLWRPRRKRWAPISISRR